jgi:protein-tyrosine phosphatase
MIDIHTHILPGIDDGAQTLAESLAMAQIALDAGDDILFATPHVAGERDFPRQRRLPARLAALRDAFAEAGLPVALHPGAEVYPVPGILAAIDDGVPLTLGTAGRHLLFDSPFTSLPLKLGERVYELQTHGITPILAHPECIVEVQLDPGVLEEHLFRGLLLQLSTSSLLGTHSAQAQRTARLLLEHRWVHFLASDAHSPRRRRPGLAPAAAALAQHVDAETAVALTEANPRRVLAGESIPTDPLPYSSPKRKGWFGALFFR